MKQKIIIATMLVWIMATTWCSLIPQTNNWQEETSNPASVFCEKNGGTLEIVPDEWWSRWKCNFDDGSFCEEWAYYHGECSPGRWDGNTVEIEEIENNEEITQEEKDEFVEVIEEIEEIRQEDFNNVVCTADVKMCDDWTYVSRQWPNCQFATCPWLEVNEDTVRENVKKYESTWSDLAESDIELMNEIINIITE